MLTPLLTGNFLRKKRKELGLTQRRLAERAQVDYRRIADWENYRRVPSEVQQRRLAQVLGLQIVPVSCAARSPLAAGRPAARVELPGPDRAMGVRLSGVKETWPELYRAFEDRLRRRADRAVVRRYLVGASAGSRYEAALHLQMLYDGRASRVAPQPGGFRLRPVVDPSTGLVVGDRPVPCIELRLDELDLLVIPQISIQVLHKGKLRAITPDFLVRVNTRRWALVEVKGGGHDSSEDELRPELVGVPVVWLEGHEVGQPDTLATVATRLREALSK